MKTATARTLALGFGLLIAGCGDDVGQPLIDDSGLPGDGTLGAHLETIRVDRGVPALAAMTIRADSIIEMAAAGFRAEGFTQKVTLQDKWHIGSLTKSMTATLAGVLVEEGVITWGTTIADVFPEYQGQILPLFEDIRLEELLEHVAGITSQVSLVPFWETIYESEDSLPAQRKRLGMELLQIASVVPRGEYYYTDGGYVIAGAMLEQAAGKSWEELIQEKVFEPLGMENTGLGPPGSPDEPNQPWGHFNTGGGWEPVPPGPNADLPPALNPANGVHTTLEDYSRYLLDHLAGSRNQNGLVTADTYARLHTSQSGVGYALGWTIQHRPWAQGFALTHNGSNRLWWATVWIAPSLNFATLALVNGAEANGRNVGREAADYATIVLITRMQDLMAKGL